jgi:hypothetical protein
MSAGQVEQIESTIRRMLSMAESAKISLTPLRGGKNNRSFLLRIEDRDLFVKSYFLSPEDPRPRGATEYTFLELCKTYRVSGVATPLAFDGSSQVGIYELLPGISFSKELVTEDAVDQAINFFSSLNRLRGTPEAQLLPHASEACFSVDMHLATVTRRLSRLSSISVVDDISRHTKIFVGEEIPPIWETIKLSLQEHVSESHEDSTSLLPLSFRCLSPSDFGFHNALTSPERVVFVDFEYSGWDDPAKTVCDFFCQPEIPVPIHFFDAVCRGFLKSTEEPFETCYTRAKALFPLYQLKWCCILLNDFLPVGNSRRAFAATFLEGDCDQGVDRRAAQLTKVQQLLSTIKVSKI